MSAPEKPDPARAWSYIERLMAEEEAERIANLSDDEVEAEMRAQGTDPASVPTADEWLAMAAARAGRGAPAGGAAKAAAEPVPQAPVPHAISAPPSAPIAPVLPLARAPRRWSPVWLIAAAFVGVIAVFAVINPNPPPLTARPTSRQLAERSRDLAAEACGAGAWAECLDDLDEAKRADPAGEGEPRVQQMRRQIAAATGHGGGLEKPGP